MTTSTPNQVSIRERAVAWLQRWDTGVSSETIWRVLMGETPRTADIPYDPDDFGRCYRLLVQVPEWRERLPEVAAQYPAWMPFVAAWDELTAMYEDGVRTNWKPPFDMYKRMKQLRGVK